MDTGVHGSIVENHFHVGSSCYSNKAPILDKQLMVVGMNLGFYELLYLDWMEADIGELKVCTKVEYVKWKFVLLHRIREWLLQPPLPSCLWGCGNGPFMVWWLLWSLRKRWAVGYWSSPSCSTPLLSLVCSRVAFVTQLTESSETLVKIKNFQRKCFGHWAIEYLVSSSEASHLASKNSSNKYFTELFMF